MAKKRHISSKSSVVGRESIILRVETILAQWLSEYAQDKVVGGVKVSRNELIVRWLNVLRESEVAIDRHRVSGFIVDAPAALVCETLSGIFVQQMFNFGVGGEDVCERVEEFNAEQREIDNRDRVISKSHSSRDGK
jgi:hypothetical protein